MITKFYPSSCYVFGGSGERLRHIGVAVGSIKGAEGRRSTVGRFGWERDKVCICVASKHKATEGVAVGQDHHGLHQLSQRPALLARLQQRLKRAEMETNTVLAQRNKTKSSIQVYFFFLKIYTNIKCNILSVFSLLYLDVRAANEPGLVGQHLIDVIKEAKATGSCLQTLQPLRVPAHPQKLRWVQVHQVVAVMTCCSLKRKEKKTQKKKLWICLTAWRWLVRGLDVF